MSGMMLIRTRILLLVVIMNMFAQQTRAELLPPCPSSPNCVSSQAADGHHIEPFKFGGNAVDGLKKLQDILALRADTKIISVTETAISVEFRTMLGFIDDGLFVLDKEQGL